MPDDQKFLGTPLPHLPDRIEPKRTLGYERLTPAEQLLADQDSINEQRSILALEVAKAAISIAITGCKILGVAIVVFLLLEGPRVHKLWSEWLGVSGAVAK